MILVPVKNLDRAKQRLASVLEQPARTELAHAMLSDVLCTLSQVGRLDVSVVTGDPFATELAGHYKFSVIPDDRNASETDAVAMATDFCVSKGILSTLVIPADVPLIEAEDLRAIYEHEPQSGCVLVPSRDKRGTNAVLRRPAGLFHLRFGNDSFIPHLTAAIATDQSCVVLSLPRIGLDIDTPDDLEELAQAQGEKPSQLLARRLGFGRPKTPSSVHDSHENRLAAES